MNYLTLLGILMHFARSGWSRANLQAENFQVGKGGLPPLIRKNSIEWLLLVCRIRLMDQLARATLPNLKICFEPVLESGPSQHHNWRLPI